jgi:undecaprenyl-diphosphatase
MGIKSIIFLAMVQGGTELLPVSSSAHVILAGKFLGFDPTTPQGVLLLLFLHSGTMCAVLIHYWKRWIDCVRTSGAVDFSKSIVIATVVTGFVGLLAKWLIEQIWLQGSGDRPIETLFGSTPLIASSLMATAILIAISSRVTGATVIPKQLNRFASLSIGAVQGLCLPFRGLSRSGATISVGMLAKLDRRLAETFSFALAVVLTPPLILREWHQLGKVSPETPLDLKAFLAQGSIGFVFSFITGLIALKWLSAWVDKGRWGYFSYYCFAVSILAFVLHFSGYLA